MIRPWKYASQKRSWLAIFSGLPRNDMDSTSKESNDKKYSLLSLYWKSLYDFHFNRHLFTGLHLHANVLTLKWIVFMNVHRPSLQFISTIYYVDDSRCTSIKLVLKPVCSKKQQKSSWPVTCLQNRGLLKDLNDSKLCIWAQVIPLIIQDQFYTIQNIQRSPSPQTSNPPGFFLLFLTANRL